MQLTAAEQALLRTRPHNTKLYLSVFQPQAVFKAQVNDAAIAQGEVNITFDNVTLGAYNDIKYDMMMYVGTTPGGDDVGRIRCRSATSSYVEVAENGFIMWADNLYLTVVNFFEIDSKYPRIVLNTGTTSTTWYKDYDTPYTNENEIHGAFVCMGPHHAGILGDDGTHQVYYTATGTVHVEGGTSIDNYYWTFEGGTPGTYTGVTPGYVSYDTPGHYTTKLNVSGTNSSYDASYRHISIYDDPYNRRIGGAQYPVISWELIKFDGNREAGGYSATIRILQEVSQNFVRDGSLVVIFAKDWYGGTKQSIGGNACNRDSIVFVGYVVDGTIHFNYQHKYIEFEVVSPSGVMKFSESFAVSVEDVDNPTTKAASKPEWYPSPWALIEYMTTKKALYHYLRWHSSVMKCMDVEFVGTNQLIQYADFDRESLYSAIDTFMRSALRGRAVCDAQGKLWLETDIYTESPRYQNPFRLDGMDYIGEPTIEEKLTPTVSFVEAGGIAYGGQTATGTNTPYMSGAPGSAPGYRGTILRVQGLALEDQDHLNDITGRIYSYETRRYPRVEFDLAGNYRNFDIAPQEQFRIYLPPEKNPRGVAINEEFHVDGINWQYDPQKELLLPSVTFSQVPSNPIEGTTIPIPPVAPVEGDDGGYDIPPIEIPPIDIPPVVVGAIGLTNILPVSTASTNCVFTNNGWEAVNLLTDNISASFWFSANGAVSFTPLISNHYGGSITITHTATLYNRFVTTEDNLTYAVASTTPITVAVNFYDTRYVAAKTLTHVVIGTAGQYLKLNLAMTARDTASDWLAVIGWIVNYV